VEFAKGVATGFVIGVALIGTAVATLYVHDDSYHERNAARIEEVGAQVQRLERAVTALSVRVSAETPLAAAPAVVTPTSLTTER